MGLHSPSSAERYLRCPGSVRLTKDAPYTSTIHSRTGTTAHAVAKECLKEGRDAFDFLGQVRDDEWEVNKGKYPPIEVTLEMMDNVQGYIDYVRNLARSVGAQKIHVEERLNLNSLYPNINGEIDVWFCDQNLRHLYVIDYKNGTDPVTAEENYQAMIYALMLVLQETSGKFFPNVTLIVYQPRDRMNTNPVSSWTTTRKHLEDWANVVLLPGIMRTMEPDAPLIPGDEQCKWCYAKQRRMCPALSDQALVPFNVTTQAMAKPGAKMALPALSALTPAEKGALLIAIKNSGLEAFIASLKTEVGTDTKAGEKTGWSYVQGKNARAWANEESAMTALAGAVDLRVQSIMSPAQAEAALKERGYAPKQFKAMVAPLVTTTPSMTLVPNNDKRVAQVANAWTPVEGE